MHIGTEAMISGTVSWLPTKLNNDELLTTYFHEK